MSTDTADLAKKIQSLIDKYNSKIEEKDRIIDQLQSDLLALTVLATEKEHLKALPELNKPTGVV